MTVSCQGCTGASIFRILRARIKSFFFFILLTHLSLSLLFHSPHPKDIGTPASLLFKRHEGMSSLFLDWLSGVVGCVYVHFHGLAATCLPGSCHSLLSMLHQLLFLTLGCPSPSHGPWNNERPSLLLDVDALTLKHLETQPRRGSGLRGHLPSWPDRRDHPNGSWDQGEQRWGAFSCCYHGVWIPHR